MVNKNTELKEKINEFKIRFNSKVNPIKIEKNSFDLFFDDLVSIIKYFNDNYFINIIKLTSKMIKKAFVMMKKFMFSFDKLEKRIIDQEKIISENLKFNNQLTEKISEISNKLNNYIDESKNILKTENKQIIPQLKNNKLSQNTEETKLEFFQEENVRLSNELYETKKKFQIMKEELSKFENQRSELINKINSVNDAIQDANIVTNVFENKVDQKINIVNPNNIKKKIEKNLDDEVREIFSK